MRKIYTLTIHIVIMTLFIYAGGINAQPIKDSILKNYTQKDYEAFLLKERRGEIPDQFGPVPLIAAPLTLVNNNAGATGTSGFTQSETSILAFGDNVVIGYNDAGSYTGGANKFTGWSYSSDGGATFTDGGTLPTNTGGDAGDPVLARDDVTGRIYYSTLQFFGNGIPIYRSDDNGQSWALPTQGAPGMSGFADKQWIAVDNFVGAGQGNVYLIVRDFGPRQGIYFFRSTDNGATFGPNGGLEIVDASSGNRQGAFVAVGTDHSVYTFWFDDVNNSLNMRKSTDFGVTFGAPVIVASSLTGPQVNGNLGLLGIRNGLNVASGFRSNSFPHAAVNPVSGDIYITFNDNPEGEDKGDIFMVMSTDGGSTWSAPQQINDDGTTTDQWQPTIAVTPDGNRLGIFYYSRQDDTDNNEFRYYGRTAEISGSTLLWDPSLPISDVLSLPEFGRDGFVNTTYMGDYNQAAATNSEFHLVWSDNRDDLAGGEPRKDPNVYYKSIPVDPFSGPNISVTPSNVDFGKIPVGNSSSVMLEVSNSGDEELILSGWSLDNPAFLNDLAVPEFIPPDGSVSINLSFNPDAFGTFDGIFTIASNANNSPNVQIQLTGMGTVENDICAYATPIPEIGCDPVTVSGSTLDATIDDDIASCGTNISAPGIWYTVEGTGTSMKASTCDAADFDTKISVYSGSCESLECIAGNDDGPGCADFTSEVSWSSTSGEVYYILVHGFETASGNFDLTISSEGFLPEIDVNPQQFEFTLEVDGSDSDIMTIGNFGDCPIDLTWFISENNPTIPDFSGYGNSTGRPVQNLQPVIYSIAEKSIRALQETGFFNEVSVQEQLESLIGQQFRTSEALQEAVSAVLTISDPDGEVLQKIQKYAVVEPGRIQMTDEEALRYATDVADPDEGMINTPLELDKNYQHSNPLASQVLFDNGPIVNSPGTGSGGADESVLQNVSLGMSILGVGHQFSLNNKVLEDFTVTGSGWILETIDFFAYQTGSTTTSTITGVYYQVYDGFPDDPGSTLVFGDFTTNRLISSEWSGVYRVNETSSGNTNRPVMKNTVEAGFVLPPGDYWIAWQVDGTLTSGPWVPPITINGQGATGNAYQSLSNGAYAEILDSGNGQPQGLPFVINGVFNDLCTWLTLGEFSGITAGQASSDVTLSVDATGLTPGTYTCDLAVSSNSLSNPVVLVPVTLEVISCFPPEELYAESISNQSADLGWTETGSATSWQVRVGPAGFDTTGVVPVIAGTNPTEVSGLSSLTSYDFYVRSECIAGGYSDWVGPYTFTTICDLPVAICKNYIFDFGLSSGQVTLNLSPEDVDNGSFAECGIASLSVSPDVFFFDCDNFNIPQVVTLTVLDVNGNTSSCNAQVYGVDNSPPTIITPGDLVLQNDPGECGAVVEYEIIISDNCDIAGSFISIPSGSFFPVGIQSVEVFAVDGQGNPANASFEVTVFDDEAPEITCPADIYVFTDEGSCEAVVEFSVTATDNCPGIVNVSTDIPSGSIFGPGTTTVAATATDAPGNQSECTFNVIVVDNKPPVIEVGDPIVIWPPNSKYETFSVEDLVVSVQDNCDEISVSNVVISMATSDEPEDARGGGDGNTLNDIVIGDDCKTVKVRKERQGKGNGRVYNIHLSVQDENGNTSMAVCQIHVPKATGKPAIDDGVTPYVVVGNCADEKSGPVSQNGFSSVQETEMIAYPNPFDNVTTISFTAGQSGDFSVRVYNSLGREVANVFEGYAEEGKSYSKNFDAGSLPEGIYYYNLKIGVDVNIMKKLILIK
jgi:hypothetical protein